MNKNKFLQSASVKDFIEWITPCLDQSGAFIHSYIMKKPAKYWECDSLYSAYENYDWSFSCIEPLSGEKVSGNSFEESSELLNKLSVELRKAIESSDYQTCKDCCLSVLSWGGVRHHNDKRINDFGENICSYLEGVIKLLTSDVSSEEYYSDRVIMNSGFSKIYSLCNDDFIIYDGRVGASLGLLVRKFCEDRELETVPAELLFAWGKGREGKYQNAEKNRRNPGTEKYKFPELTNKPKNHIENNIRANWLLREILNNTDSKFKSIDVNNQMRALEAALFMIGYDVSMN